MESRISTPILVTGATGELGCHIIKQLLEQGHRVRGTVRSLSQSQFLYNLSPSAKENLELFEADFFKLDKWDGMIQGCEYIIHTASLIPSLSFKDLEKHGIKQVVGVTRDFLQAAVRNKVKKFVATSSFFALWVGNEYRTVTEQFWAEDLQGDAYAFIKVEVEKAIWQFEKENKSNIEVTTICPGLMLGPKLSQKINYNEEFIRQVFVKKLSAIPDLNFAVVDVRDVAQAHIQALLNPKMSGKRFILANKSMALKDIVEILGNEFEKHGYVFPKKVMKRCSIKFGSMFDEDAKKLLMYFGKKVRFDNKLSINEAEVKYRDVQESILESANSLIKFGAIPELRKAS